VNSTLDTEGTRLYHGDCTNLDVLEDESIDMVFTDPPFNVSFSDYGGQTDDHRSVEEYSAWTRQWIEEALRVLVTGGQLYALMPFKWIPWWTAGIADLWKAHKGHILPWCKTLANLHREKTYLRAWEPILWLTKGGRPNVLRRAYRFAGDKDWVIGRTAISESEANRLAKRHATPRPVWLAEYFISRATEPGMVVCDPMVGTGATGRAARKLGRQFVGVDIDRRCLQEVTGPLLAQQPMGLGEIDEVPSFGQLELISKWEET